MRSIITILFFSIFLCSSAKDKTLKVAGIFGDNMVIQQGIRAPVWGTADPHTEVSVSFAGSTSKLKSDNSGKWMIRMPLLKAGGPYQMSVISGGDSVILNNVMVGEVWLASGQSNMQLVLPAVTNSAEELRAANYPNIRFFTVKNTFSSYPLQEVEGSWKSCDPNSARTFSAVAYFFARALHKDKTVAVGVISSSWGSTPSEAWTSAQALSNHPDFADSIRSYSKLEQDWLKIYYTYQEKHAAIRNSNRGIEENVHLINYDDHSWKKAEFPLGLRPPGFFTWYRKKFIVENPHNHAYTLLLKNVNGDVDVYLNGKSLEQGKSEKGALSFIVPAGWVKSDSNILAVRHIVFWEQGKMGDKKGDFSLISSSQKVTSLDGEWRFNGTIEPRFPTFPKQKNYPTALYNGMIAPLVPFGIKGVIWYQGENNSSRAKQYQTLFPLLINDWRDKWGSVDLPFLFVQLASFRSRNLQPVSDNWAMLREAQTMALKLPNTGMAVTIDIGDAHNIHPKNKQDVGMRLYLAAKKIAYHQNVVYSGPIYESMSIRNNEIVLSFKHIGSGLTSKGSSLKGFAIAGEDHRFYWADAKIVGDTVAVSSPNVKKPVAVRYAWSTNPECNLYNKEHLPASPFRTDCW